MQSAHGSGQFSGITARGIAHLAGLVDDLIAAKAKGGGSSNVAAVNVATAADLEPRPDPALSGISPLKSRRAIAKRYRFLDRFLGRMSKLQHHHGAGDLPSHQTRVRGKAAPSVLV